MPNLRVFCAQASDIFVELGGQLRLESLRCDAKLTVQIDVSRQRN